MLLIERKLREMSSDVREYGEKLTRECFFLEDRSSVVSYKLSTKFRRHGTFTSFFTVWGKTNNAEVSVNIQIYNFFFFFLPNPNVIIQLYTIYS